MVTTSTGVVNMAPEEVDIEQRQTLWVGGLNEKVTEEILYELFQNVSLKDNTVS
jgi:RNA recognition motif-containing protein